MSRSVQELVMIKNNGTALKHMSNIFLSVFHIRFILPRGFLFGTFLLVAYKFNQKYSK